jgi:hypothetical protein
MLRPVLVNPEDQKLNPPSEYSPDTDEELELVAGYKKDFDVSSLGFKMVYVPAIASFPVGEDDLGLGSVENPFFIGETEISCGLWEAVRLAGQSLGYEFLEGTCGHKKSPYEGFVGPGSLDHPVTVVSWYDALVFCNALSELLGLDPVYKGAEGFVIKNALEQRAELDLMNEDLHAVSNGFRLPNSLELELAARYRGNDSTNTVSGYGPPYFTKGNSASGAANNQLEEIMLYVRCSSESTLPVASLRPNYLGIYDMTGNVEEVPFDLYIKGGFWDASCVGAQIGLIYDRMMPFTTFSSLGFRLAMSVLPD